MPDQAVTTLGLVYRRISGRMDLNTGTLLLERILDAPTKGIGVVDRESRASLNSALTLDVGVPLLPVYKGKGLDALYSVLTLRFLTDFEAGSGF